MTRTTKARRCGDKTRHRTQDAALAHRRRLIDAGAAPQRITTYHCRHCHAWHIGHNTISKRVQW